MKTLLATLLFVSSLAFAGETVILDLPANSFASYGKIRGDIEVDLSKGNITGVLEAYTTDYCSISQDGCAGPTDWVIQKKRALIDSLVIENDQIIYKGEEGDVDCGRIKHSRIFKSVFTVILANECSVDARFVRVNGEKRAQLVLSVEQ